MIQYLPLYLCRVDNLLRHSVQHRIVLLLEAKHRDHTHQLSTQHIHFCQQTAESLPVPRHPWPAFALPNILSHTQTYCSSKKGTQ